VGDGINIIMTIMAHAKYGANPQPPTPNPSTREIATQLARYNLRDLIYSISERKSSNVKRIYVDMNINGILVVPNALD
jgi:hypothetical protein